MRMEWSGAGDDGELTAVLLVAAVRALRPVVALLVLLDALLSVGAPELRQLGGLG